VLGIAFASVRHRIVTFATAFIALVLGSGAITMTASALVATSSTRGHPQVDGGSPLLAAQNMAGQSTGLMVCIVVFIVIATFALMIDLRQRELALFSLLGTSAGQLWRLILGEVVIVAVTASVVGCVLGSACKGILRHWMVVHALAPNWFHVGFSIVAVVVAFVVTVTAAIIGAAVVAIRATRVRPLDALREADIDTRTISPSRLVFGLLLLLGAVVAAHGIATTEPRDAVNPRKYADVPVLLVGGFVMLTPLLLAPISMLMSRLGTYRDNVSLVQAGIAYARRRTAASAVPIAVSVGLVGALMAVGAGSTHAIVERAKVETGATYVIVPRHSLSASRLPSMPGAIVTPVTKASINIATMRGMYLDTLNGQAVPDGALGRSLQPTLLSGSLRSRSGNWLVVDQRTANSDDLVVGQLLRVTLPNRRIVDLRVSAIIASGLTSDDTYLPNAYLAGASVSVAYVRSTTGSGISDATLSELRASLPPNSAVVERATKYFDEEASRLAQQTRTAATLILGIPLLYCLIAVANTLVLAIAHRKREFAAYSLIGMTRSQLIRLVMLESVLAVGLGVIPAFLATAGTIAAQHYTLLRLVPSAPVQVPWSDVCATLGACLLFAACTSVLTSTRILRMSAVKLVSAS
jgi:putative ABC transport system permease protein